MRAPFAVRTYVFGLIVVVLVPLLAFSGFLVIRSAQHEQELMAATVRERTRGSARAFERELGVLRDDLLVIANSEALSPGNLPALYARANDTPQRHGQMVVLSDAEGRELVNTLLPLDARLPDFPDPEAIRKVVATGLPYVSDLTISSASHQPVVMINEPILQNGRVAYIISMDVIPSLAQLATQLQLPQDWLITILDRNGTIICRSRDADQFIGAPARPSFVQAAARADQGWFPFVTREGVPVYNALSRIGPVGWAVIIAIPIDVLYGPVRHSTMILVLAGIGTLTLALLLATLIGRHFAQPIRGLVRYAEGVGRGEPIGLPRTGLLETDMVAASLHQASESLQRSGREREAAAEALRQSEQQYRILAGDLARANEERKQLLERIVQVQEAERKRIARELHDSLGQYLTALQLGLSSVGQNCGDAALPRLTELRGLTAEVGQELNRIARELRPTVLDDFGLQTAITQYLEEWAERSHLQFELQINLGSRRLPLAVETTLYRVLQEAVTNVVKHAEADRVGVILEAAAHEVRLIVEDNGTGFALQEDAGQPEPDMRHLGLLGMRERLALLNGSLELESAPGTGTTLFIRVPI